jgi:hypothetical protein
MCSMLDIHAAWSRSFVLRSERLQHEPVSCQPGRWLEPLRHEACHHEPRRCNITSMSLPFEAHRSLLYPEVDALWARR